MNLRPYCVNGGQVSVITDGFRLTLPPMGAYTYADAQIDDYQTDDKRFIFQQSAPQHLRLHARFSHQAMTGTCGFGFWNHPFGQMGDVLAPPCNLWFFNASRQSDMRTVRGVPGWGFKAAMLDSAAALPGVQSPRIFNLISHVINPLLRLPLLSRLMLALAQALVRANEVVLAYDWTAWHRFEIDWQPRGARFLIDEDEVMHTTCVPHGPLGFVAWVDNYQAVAHNDRYEFGYVACGDKQWMEVKFS